jgi:hypothetical protein
MSKTKKKEWTRRAHYWIVEIKVGNAWVQAAKLESSSNAAERLANKKLKDPSVSAVKVTEHEIEHVCSLVMSEFGQAVSVRVPNKFTQTGETGVCRVCYGRTVIAVDNSKAPWAFCEQCERALPV